MSIKDLIKKAQSITISVPLWLALLISHSHSICQMQDPFLITAYLAKLSSCIIYARFLTFRGGMNAKTWMVMISEYTDDFQYYRKKKVGN